jgi:hypothetical protein
MLTFLTYLLHLILITASKPIFLVRYLLNERSKLSDITASEALNSGKWKMQPPENRETPAGIN